MKIGIFADLHGNIDAWHTIMDGVFKDADQVLCAGDTFGAGLANPFSSSYHPQKLKEVIAHPPKPIVIVRGNCDAKGIYPDSASGTLGNKKYYLCHGQHCPSDEEKLKLAHQYHADFFIYGHTHLWRLEKTGDVVIINPGSPTTPQKKPKHDTVAVMTDHTIEIIDIHSRDVLATLAL